MTPPTQNFNKIYQELKMPTARVYTAKNKTQMLSFQRQKDLAQTLTSRNDSNEYNSRAAAQIRNYKKQLISMDQRLTNQQKVITTLQAQVKDHLDKKGHLYTTICARDIKI
jgi:hypothetical protein